MRARCVHVCSTGSYPIHTRDVISSYCPMWLRTPAALGEESIRCRVTSTSILPTRIIQLAGPGQQSETARWLVLCHSDQKGATFPESADAVIRVPRPKVPRCAKTRYDFVCHRSGCDRVRTIAA